MSKRARLFGAYEWICDECGAQNFASCPRSDYSEEEHKRRFMEAHGIENEWDLPEDYMDYEEIAVPKQVRCEDCHTIYDAHLAPPFGEEDEDE